MNRRFSTVAGILGALALVVTGATANLHAQRGAGATHGRPATAGTQSHGRPATAGTQGHGMPATAGRPADARPGASNAGHAKDHADNAKATRAEGTSGRPTVSDQLTRNTNLASKLTGILPAGTDLQKASSGFKNLGQFVAAAHVSHNLDIPFDSLKAKMTGSTPMSLGDAIHELKPTADANTEQRKAERAADDDIKSK